MSNNLFEDVTGFSPFSEFIGKDEINEDLAHKVRIAVKATVGPGDGPPDAYRIMSYMVQTGMIRTLYDQSVLVEISSILRQSL